MNTAPPSTILIVALRRIGDVLLTTPLVRTLRRAYSEAAIDMLVFQGTEGILAGNPDLRRVIALPQRPSAAEQLGFAGALFRAYDLAISTQTGDRPTLLATLAGKKRIGPRDEGLAARVKSLALTTSVPPDPLAHRVEETLRLAAALGLAPLAEVVAPIGPAPMDAPKVPYAVVHAAPMFRYKRWTAEGWRALARALNERDLTVVATGGPGAEERRFLDSVWDGLAIERCEGLPWPTLGGLLRGARLYIGPDTSVTHLAAAIGTPTVALYGPTDPRLWGPWPVGGLATPWMAAAPHQRRGNVHLVQTPLPCTPCQAEGCERRLDSHARCLDEMTVDQVLVAVDRALAESA